jgi:hypothetical protein
VEQFEAADSAPLQMLRDDDHRLRAGREFLLLDFFHPVVERNKLVDGDGADRAVLAGDDSREQAVGSGLVTSKLGAARPSLPLGSSSPPLPFSLRTTVVP